MKLLFPSLLFASSALAENAGHSFLDTALTYDKKATISHKAGDTNNAAIYTRLAAIKREAYAANGKYDWSEYHKLSSQLNHPPKHQPKTTQHSGFEETAKKYDKLAADAHQLGKTSEAATYERLAAIKREAHAADGKYDWSEYHKLEARLKNAKKLND